MDVVPSSCLFTTADLSQNGLNAEYFDNVGMACDALLKRVDASVDFTCWATAPFEGLRYDCFSVR